MSVKPDLNELKQQGNAAHQAGDFRAAIFFFSTALESTKDASGQQVLYSNRSASYCMLEDYTRALEDAETVIKMKPDWAKGYSRRGLALHCMRQYGDAIEAYQKGLSLDPDNQLIKKGLEDVLEAQKHHEMQPYQAAHTLSDKNRNDLDQLLQLPQLGDVRWHLCVFHDRIWLADPPFAPFRPRSIFIFDSVRLQMLGMAPHTTRNAIDFDEVLDFLTKTCCSHNIRPASLEISDARLWTILETHLKGAQIDIALVPLSSENQLLLRDTVKTFDEREQEQWKRNNKFSGVLKQRKQEGLLSVPGVTPEFAKYFLDAAAFFYRSRAYLYLPIPVGIKIGQEPLKVITVVRNEQGVFGLKVWKENKGQGPPVCLQTMMFHDPSNVPFYDADDFERYGWASVEGKYPFPILGSEEDGDVKRPPLSVLQWLEAAMRALTVSVSHTTALPTFQLDEGSEGTIHRCNVHTHAGVVQVIVSCPPNASETPDAVFDEPTPAPPVQKMLHDLGGVASSVASRPANPLPQATSSPAPRAAPQTIPKPTVKPAPIPPPVPTEPASASSSFTMTMDIGEDVGVSMDSTPTTDVPEVEGDNHWRQEQAALGSFRQVWKTEQVQREGLLHHLSALLLDSEGEVPQLRNKCAQQEQTIESLTSQLEHIKSKYEFQAQQIKSQNDLIQQLQSHASQLEKSERGLRKELDMRKNQKAGTKEVLDALSSGVQATIHALHTTQDDFKKWIEVVNSDTTVQRQKNLERLGKTKGPGVANLEAKVTAAKKRVANSGWLPDDNDGNESDDSSAPKAASVVKSATRQSAVATQPKGKASERNPDFKRQLMEALSGDSPAEDPGMASTLTAPMGTMGQQGMMGTSAYTRALPTNFQPSATYAADQYSDGLGYLDYGQSRSGGYAF